MPLANSTDGSIMQKVVNSLKEANLDFQRLEDRPEVNMQVSYGNGLYAISILVDEERAFIVVRSCPSPDARVSYSKRKAMNEYLTRINYGLWVGNFEFDLDSGEVRHKTSIIAHDSVESLSNNMIQSLWIYSVIAMDHYLPDIMRINNSDEKISIKRLVQESGG